MVLTMAPSPPPHPFEQDRMVGWLAVLTAIFCFGSFAAPAKTKRVVDANVHPLVYQTYKSFWCFATSWLVLLIPGVSFSFTPFALLSALFWVPGGWMAIASVQYAGLAISQATWSSFIVLVSFVSGIAVFHEPVQSWPVVATGLFGMVCSIVGMAWFSDPNRAKARAATKRLLPSEGLRSDSEAAATDGGMPAACHHHAGGAQIGVHGMQPGAAEAAVAVGCVIVAAGSAMPSAPINERCGRGDHDAAAGAAATAAAAAAHLSSPDEDSSPVCCGRARLSNRWIGFLLAMGCGLWGGSLPTPLKLAEAAAKRAHTDVPVGFAFVTSFGISVAFVTAFVWIGYLSIAVAGLGYSWPSLQLRVMFVPGMIAGLAWSAGNAASILAVMHLGEALGYSACQASLVVSGKRPSLRPGPSPSPGSSPSPGPRPCCLVALLLLALSDRPSAAPMLGTLPPHPSLWPSNLPSPSDLPSPSSLVPIPLPLVLVVRVRSEQGSGASRSSARWMGATRSSGCASRSSARPRW